MGGVRGHVRRWRIVRQRRWGACGGISVGGALTGSDVVACGARRIIVTPFAAACAGDWCSTWPPPPQMACGSTPKRWSCRTASGVRVCVRTHVRLLRIVRQGRCGVQSTPNHRNTIRRSLRRRLVPKVAAPPLKWRAAARRNGGQVAPPTGCVFTGDASGGGEYPRLVRLSPSGAS